MNLVPRPRIVLPPRGVVARDDRSAIGAPGEAAAVAALLREQLRPATGLALASGGADASIRLRIDRDALPGPEAYRIEVDADRVDLVGGGPAGLFCATQTLRQLLPPQVFSPLPVAGIDWTVPAVTIEDEPRFTWRGALLDVARHHYPKAWVMRFIDLAAMHKLNMVQLHLTDDQGWRLEIRKHPRLTEVGAWRRETIAGHDPLHLEYHSPMQRIFQPASPVFDGIPHGGFYTREDIAEIVAYAARRFITIVPEVEMPGHMQAAVAAYPELGNTGEPVEVWTRWGISKHVLNVEDATVGFCRDVLAEVMELFPGPFVHIGGDEVPKDEWRASPAAQRRIRKLGLRDEAELQAWFTRQLVAFLEANGRRLVGWDEIIEGGLAPGATVMSWRGEEGGIAAARADHAVVMAPVMRTYFNLYEVESAATEPIAFPEILTLPTAYAFDPIPPELTPDEARHILGGQCALWSEYSPNGAVAERALYPRTCAFSEAVWSAEKEPFERFRERLGLHLRRLDAMDVRYRPLD